MLLAEPVDDGGDGLAGTAPGGVAVNQDELVAADSLHVVITAARQQLVSVSVPLSLILLCYILVTIAGEGQREEQDRKKREARGEDTYLLISWTTMFAVVGEKSLALEEEKSLVEAGAVVVCSGGRADVDESEEADERRAGRLK